MNKIILISILAVALSVAFYATWPPPPLPAVVHVDKVVVIKHLHILELQEHGRVVTRYTVALGRGGLGPKERQGDHKTPEGLYILDSRNANSNFHKALHVSYPNQIDLARTSKLNAPAGGLIEIHGIRNDVAWLGRWHRWVDWTDGCIALTDKEMDQIWSAVSNGTSIEIKP